MKSKDDPQSDACDNYDFREYIFAEDGDDGGEEAEGDDDMQVLDQELGVLRMQRQRFDVVGNDIFDGWTVD